MIYFIIFLLVPCVAIAVPVGATLATTAFFTSLSAATGIAAPTLASIATFAALSAASVGLNLLFAPGGRSSANPQDLKNTVKGSEGPGRHSFGRVEVGAKVAFGNTKGYSLYRVLLHSFGPLDAVEAYIYDGNEIVIDSVGNVSSPPWVFPGGSYMNIQVQPGDGTETAFQELITDFPSLWTSDHKLQGIFHSLLKITNPGTSSAIFPKLLNGGIKELNLRCRNGKFYDPRDVSTKWTINGVLHCLHYIRLLPGVKDSDIDIDAIGLIASQGEEFVPTLTGVAPRCQLSGGWESSITSDIVSEMLESAGLEENVNDEGQSTFTFLEDNPEPQLTLTSKHIIDREYKSGPEGALRPNICKLEYFSPERRYEVADIDITAAPWAKVQREVDRYGEQEFTVELKFCSDASQAQRIARRLFHMKRADFGTIRTTFAGIAAWGMKTVSIEFPDVGIDGASVFKTCRIGTVRVNDQEGTCDIPFQVIPDILKTPWNPIVDEQPAPPILLIGQFESELDTPAAPTAATVVEYSDLSRETRVIFAPVSGAEQAEADIRTYTGGLPNAFTPMVEIGLSLAYLAGDKEGERADFRVRFFNAVSEASHTSELLEIPALSIDNTPLTPAAQNVVVNVFNFDVGVIVANDLHVAQSEVQYRIYITGTPAGAWIIDDVRNARPNDVYTHTLSVDSSTGLSIGETLAIRTAVVTSNGTASTSTEYTFDKI